MKLNYPLNTTLGKDICFLCWIKEAAEATWAANRRHAPQVVFRKKGRVGMLTVTRFVTSADKEDTIEIIRRLRQDCDTVVFICEALLVKPNEGGRVRRDGLAISVWQPPCQPEGWVAFIDPRTRQLELPWVKCAVCLESDRHASAI